jgi:hypothetical protein
MKYLLLIAYTDLSDDRARCHVEPFEAESEDAAKAYAEQTMENGEALMDLVLPLDNWRSYPELQGLKGKKIFDAHGLHVGDVEVWTLDKLVQFCPDSPWEEDGEDEAA